MRPLNPILLTILKIASIALYLLTIASAYSGLVPPPVWATPAILTLALPYLATASLIVAVIWLVCSRWITGGLGIAALIFCWGPLSIVFPFGHERKAEAGEEPRFTVLSYNILHAEDIGGPPDANKALEYVLHSGADIVALQEMADFGSSETKKFPKALKDSLRRAYPYILTGRFGSYGNDLTLLSRYPATMADLSMLPSHRYFYEVYQINVKGRRLTMINTHLTSFNLDEEEREIVADIRGVRSARSSIAEFKGTVLGKLKEGFRMRARNAVELRAVISMIKGPLIVCGDFNDVPSSWAYSTIRGEDLKDAYTETNFGPGITFNAHYLWFHLDQVLYRGDLKALSVKRGSLKASDHYPQLAEFVFTH